MFKKANPLLRFCFLALSILTASAGVLGQSQATTGNIEGRVIDPNGAVLPGVTITARNQNTGLAKTATVTMKETTALLFYRRADTK